jgi:WD40 repeat protein
VTLPVVTTGYIGTSIPRGTEPIGAGNIDKLTFVAQWGRGILLGTAFTADGRAFVVGSPFGLAVYKMNDLGAYPAWIPFASPTLYQNLWFSQDGKYILLAGDDSTGQVIQYPDGQPVSTMPDVTWLETTTMNSGWGAITVVSPDGRKRLGADSIHDEEMWDLEYSIRTVYDTASGNVLYELPDETFYVYYGNGAQPEGCDITFFSMCGNAYVPSAYHPYRAAFSPDGNTLAILYRAPNRWNSSRFSVLRVYDAASGKLLNVIGNLDLPVETFTYSPDGNRLLVAYIDGSIQLLDARGNHATFGAHHFNFPIAYLTYSHDSRTLLIQRFGTSEAGRLEVRRATNGALIADYQSAVFTVSPVDDRIAVADADGNIRIIDLDTGETLQKIPAHHGLIYSLAFSPNGQNLASSGRDCQVKLWDSQNGSFLHYFEETVENPYGFQPSRILVDVLHFIPGTNQLIGFGSWGTVVDWNVDSGATRFKVESAPLSYYNGMVTLDPHFPEFFSLDPTNNLFYINELGFDLATGQSVSNYQPPAALPEGCAASGPVTADGRLMFSVGYESREGEICVLDAADLHLIRTIRVLPSSSGEFTLDWVYLSPDGSQLLTTNLGSLYVYQITY